MKKAATIIAVGILALTLTFSRCANVTGSISGGPKDSIPPIPLSSQPIDGSVNFSGQLVEIRFDEYLKLKDQRKNFTVSPAMARAPIFRTKGKTVRVEFQDTLRKNTTYVIDFGNSITDNNEGNVLENFSLTFSTGSTIDSAVIEGKVLDAFTLQPVEGAFVFLYENDVDSLPLKVIPDAIVRVKPDGYFMAKGLKEIPYKLVAVEDKNQNAKYDSGTEMVGFRVGMVTAEQKKDSVVQSDTIAVNRDNLLKIALFSENTKKQYLESYTRDEERKAVLAFSQRNPEILSLDFVGIDSTQIIRERSFWGDTLTYWFVSDTVPKVLRADISYMRPDSLNNIVPFDAELKFPELKPNAKPDRKSEEKEKEKIPTIAATVNINADRVVETGIMLELKAPLVSFDTTMVRLYKFNDLRDTLKAEIPFTISQSKKGLCYYHIQADWKTSEAYQLVIDSLAMTDIYGLNSDRIERRFETPNETKYGILALSFSNVDGEGQYIVQLLDGKNIIQEKYFDNDGTVAFSFIPPKTYKVRLIHDANGNGRWDTGSYLEQVQPESVIFLKMPNGTEEIELKANWENELKIDLHQQFHIH